MAMTDDDAIVPLPPPERPVEPWIEYDELSDTLMVYFFGDPEPAISYRVPGSKHAYLRLDLGTYQTLGMQIEGVLAGFLRDHPEFIELARQAGAPVHELDRIEREVAEDALAAEQLRIALVRLMKADAEEVVASSA